MQPVEAENIIDPIVGVVGVGVPSKSCLKGQIIHARCKIIQFIIYFFIDIVEGLGRSVFANRTLVTHDDAKLDFTDLV